MELLLDTCIHPKGGEWNTIPLSFIPLHDAPQSLCHSFAFVMLKKNKKTKPNKQKKQPMETFLTAALIDIQLR